LAPPTTCSVYDEPFTASIATALQRQGDRVGLAVQGDRHRRDLVAHDQPADIVDELGVDHAVGHRRGPGVGHREGGFPEQLRAGGRLGQRHRQGVGGLLRLDQRARGVAGGEFVNASSALGEALAMFLCPLGVALALLVPLRPQVLGLAAAR